MDQPNDVERAKLAAAEAAALLAEDEMAVGLGTGTTVAHFLPALARRRLRIRCVVTSLATERAALELGLQVEPFDGLDRLDLAVDGADQVGPRLWLMKGGGGAHTREKIVAAAANRFVVIVDRHKILQELRPPVPLELMPFGLGATLRRLSELGPVRRTEASATPDGNVLASFEGLVDDPIGLSSALDAVPGVVGHGLFAPELVSEVFVGSPNGEVERLTQ